MRKYLCIICAILCISCGRNTPGKDGNSTQAGPEGTGMLSPRGGETSGSAGDSGTYDPTTEDFRKYITITNASTASKYSVPIIWNQILGIEDGEAPGMVKNNDVLPMYGGFQVVLKSDIDPRREITLTVKNSKHTFTKTLAPEAISVQDEEKNQQVIAGYYENVAFENKFWLSDGSDWDAVITAGGEVLLDKNVYQYPVQSMVFETVDDTPFAVNRLRDAELNKQYTFRCGSNTGLVVVYFSSDYGIYSPVLYLLPGNADTAGGYTDIGISWTSEAVRGLYYFAAYELNSLPKQEQTIPIFDYVNVE